MKPHFEQRQYENGRQPEPIPKRETPRVDRIRISPRDWDIKRIGVHTHSPHGGNRIYRNPENLRGSQSEYNTTPRLKSDNFRPPPPCPNEIHLDLLNSDPILDPSTPMRTWETEVRKRMQIWDDDFLKSTSFTVVKNGKNGSDISKKVSLAEISEINIPLKSSRTEIEGQFSQDESHSKKIRMQMLDNRKIPSNGGLSGPAPEATSANTIISKSDSEIAPARIQEPSIGNKRGQMNPLIFTQPVNKDNVDTTPGNDANDTLKSKTLEVITVKSEKLDESDLDKENSNSHINLNTETIGNSDVPANWASVAIKLEKMQKSRQVSSMDLDDNSENEYDDIWLETNHPIETVILENDYCELNERNSELNIEDMNDAIPFVIKVEKIDPPTSDQISFCHENQILLVPFKPDTAGFCLTPYSLPISGTITTQQMKTKLDTSAAIKIEKMDQTLIPNENITKSTNMEYETMKNNSDISKSTSSTGELRSLDARTLQVQVEDSDQPCDVSLSPLPPPKNFEPDTCQTVFRDNESGHKPEIESKEGDDNVPNKTGNTSGLPQETQSFRRKDSDARDDGVTDEQKRANVTQKLIINQVEYIFSDEYLAKDGFFRKQIGMRSDGYVSLKLIAERKQVKQISRDLPTILAALRLSLKLDVSLDGTKVRRIEPLPPFLQFLSISDRNTETNRIPPSVNLTHDELLNPVRMRNAKSNNQQNNKRRMHLDVMTEEISCPITKACKRRRDNREVRSYSPGYNDERPLEFFSHSNSNPNPKNNCYLKQSRAGIRPLLPTPSSSNSSFQFIMSARERIVQFPQNTGEPPFCSIRPSSRSFDNSDETRWFDGAPFPTEHNRWIADNTGERRRQPPGFGQNSWNFDYFGKRHWADGYSNDYNGFHYAQPYSNESFQRSSEFGPWSSTMNMGENEINERRVPNVCDFSPPTTRITRMPLLATPFKKNRKDIKEKLGLGNGTSQVHHHQSNLSSRQPLSRADKRVCCVCKKPGHPASVCRYRK